MPCSYLSLRPGLIVRPDRVEFPVGDETSPRARRRHIRRISLGVHILNSRPSLSAVRNMYIPVSSCNAYCKPPCRYGRCRPPIHAEACCTANRVPYSWLNPLVTPSQVFKVGVRKANCLCYQAKLRSPFAENTQYEKARI